MQKTTSRLLSPVFIFAVGLGLLLGFGYLWWTDIYNAPRHVFESMLNNSLQLRGVSRQVVQGGQQQNTQQLSQLSFVPVPVVRADTALSQLPATTVETESVGTPYDDYVRYTDIDTDQTNLAGEAIDFNSILNVWGQSAVLPDIGRTDGELFAESVLGVIPFGMLNANQRQEIVAMMMDGQVYEINYDNVLRDVNNGRPQYIYPVEINPEAYITMLKRYGEMIGLNNLDQLDPSAYAGAESLPFSLTVDVWSRQLVGIAHEQSGRSESLSGHNASYEVAIPQDAITVEELQERLQSLQ